MERFDIFALQSLDKADFEQLAKEAVEVEIDMALDMLAEDEVESVREVVDVMNNSKVRARDMIDDIVRDFRRQLIAAFRSVDVEVKSVTFDAEGNFTDAKAFATVRQR